ncbi:hypothetical protein B0H14DRAFT_2559457 [Mycena olivaceomarginata]|nr:hypothetical protein B0H14DRAFT_2559457 [Mycena olivaceomarginata]
MACVPSGLTNLVDFQGHVLDNSFGGLSASNPVIGQFFSAGDANQEWAFITHTTTPALTFLIVNGDNEAAAFLSYAGSGAPAQFRLFGQAAIQTIEPLALAFTIKCTSANTAIIQDTNLGLALTAWAAVNTSTITPASIELMTACINAHLIVHWQVTYESVDGRPGQTWKLESLD